MKNSLGFDVSDVRFLRCIKNAELMENAIALYARPPSSASTRDAKKPITAARHGLTDILQIDGVGNIPEVFPSVVEVDSVLVVNLITRPMSGYVEPCQPVGSVESIENPNTDAILLGVIPSDISRGHSMRCWSYPSEVPGSSVVAKTLLEDTRAEHIGMIP